MAAPDLTDVPRVGPAMAERLRAAGISTVARLARASQATLVAIPGVGPATATSLKDAAAALAGGTTTVPAKKVAAKNVGAKRAPVVEKRSTPVTKKSRKDDKKGSSKKGSSKKSKKKKSKKKKSKKK